METKTLMKSEEYYVTYGGYVGGPDFFAIAQDIEHGETFVNRLISLTEEVAQLKAKLKDMEDQNSDPASERMSDGQFWDDAAIMAIPHPSSKRAFRAADAAEYATVVADTVLRARRRRNEGFMR